ncbi:hypothetical protein [Leifsonia shinshuensis]|uniref:hypothetical protein n=1 Tax=Leifsonia TaxID=110932 RepID=UPI0028624C3B|nr:hypothetical protein [Leifsonia shinshuensis]MDR6969824.1 Co/Zn/Cd efflux system component [Leifsonia shinshuensis]
MKEVAWYVLGFSAAVCTLAFGLLLAPGAADATHGTGGLLQHLTSTQWADLVVGLVFAAIAFVSGSYLSSRAASEAVGAMPSAAPTVELVTAKTAG